LTGIQKRHENKRFSLTSKFGTRASLNRGQAAGQERRRQIVSNRYFTAAANLVKKSSASFLAAPLTRR
jgi:hypothetical protein